MIRKIVLVIPNYNWDAENKNGGGGMREYYGILYHIICVY